MWRNRQTRWIQVPVSAMTCGFKSHHLHQEKAETLLGFGFFLYDDVELKALKKRGPQKIQKIFWGRGTATERLRRFIFDKMPLSGVWRDESPIICTKCDC